MTSNHDLKSDTVTFYFDLESFAISDFLLEMECLGFCNFISLKSHSISMHHLMMTGYDEEMTTAVSHNSEQVTVMQYLAVICNLCILISLMT